MRYDISSRAEKLALPVPPERTVGEAASIVHMSDGSGGHGNFLTASYRRICADPAWAARLRKAYTASARFPRRHDRWRGELECANSSDALLMNVFCFPGVLRRPAVCRLLGVDPGLRPEFGVRAELAMVRGEVDRTELDMRIGDALVEAKLTESGFGTASAERLLRYEGLEAMFDLGALPRAGARFAGYQILRGLLAAQMREARYVVMLDGRRKDLAELCFQVARAAWTSETACRLRLVSWQDLAACLPPQVQAFLTERYGIEAE